ncbi:MAG: UDP-N-acetylmuramate dehydrogenase [Oscillospiraceae bacterium]|nr:UDP-N-acetylmuramate dehydrogenase [Oscillospiraceae bacterium]
MNLFSVLEERILARFPDVELRKNEPMEQHTSFRIGGPALLMVLPKTEEELLELCRIARETDVEPLVIGNGSNLLVADEGISAFVVKTFDGLKEIRLEGDHELVVQSGALLSQAASFALNRGLSGMEFAQGIPGTIGGAVVMNAGAYGGEMRDVVTETSYLDLKTGEIRKACGQAQEFSYRNSIFSNGEKIIFRVRLRLRPDDPESIRARMESYSRRRRESQPLDRPSAGSTFKRPQGHFAAALIDQAGLKGFTVGGAQVSPKHAGFIVNLGNATCGDVLRLVEQVRKRVLYNSGVRLDLEVRVLGADGKMKFC